MGDIMTRLLEVDRLSKSFPGVQALQSVSLDARGGEVLALMGENGAGKSTLIKTIAGAQLPDAGTIRWQGEPVSFSSPVAASRAGIAVIYQEFNLIPAMTVQENLFLGRSPSVFRFTRRKQEREAAKRALERVGMRLDPDARVSTLTVAEQQSVEIAKALLTDARLVIMDEPTAALSHQEVEKLFSIIRELKRRQVGIIYVSHRLEEVFAISDRITVLRDGALVGTRPTAELTREELIRMMVGRSVEQEYPKDSAQHGDVVLEARGLKRGKRVRGVDLQVREGEVLGLAGLVGAGRTETARILAGVDRPEDGSIYIMGKRAVFSSPRRALSAGICLLPEDRKTLGLIPSQTIHDNFALPNLRAHSHGGFVRDGKITAALAQHINALSIRLADSGQKAESLSGGNQQKVVLAKWLERNTRVLIFDEPTRGVDVGAKVEIYRLINRLAAAGKAIIMISSDLPEVLGMSDRILVMHEGTVKGEIQSPREATQEDILTMAIGA